MGIVARDVMQSDVRTVEPDASLAQLEQLLIDAKVSGAPVVEQDRLVGIVSRADVVRALSEQHRRAESLVSFYADQADIGMSDVEFVARETQMVAERMAKLRVRDAMSETRIAVAPDAPLAEVAKQMDERGIHRVLVTEGDRLLGIVSSLDVVRLVSRGRLAPV